MSGHQTAGSILLHSARQWLVCRWSSCRGSRQGCDSSHAVLESCQPPWQGRGRHYEPASRRETEGHKNKILEGVVQKDVATWLLSRTWLSLNTCWYIGGELSLRLLAYSSWNSTEKEKVSWTQNCYVNIHTYIHPYIRLNFTEPTKCR